MEKISYNRILHRVFEDHIYLIASPIDLYALFQGKLSQESMAISRYFEWSFVVIGYTK
jgi:hypothetical protein